MEAVILIGLQASGKSSFCRQRFFDSHIRINLDMLKTKNREKLLIAACLEGKQAFVIDKTNPKKADRQSYIDKAKEYGFKVSAYYFKSKPSECLGRNKNREEAKRVPDKGLLGTYKALELPSYEEGYDELYYVELKENPDSGSFEFVVSDWQEEK